MMVCYSKKVKSNLIQAPINTLKLFVNKIEHKLPVQNTEVPVWSRARHQKQVCARMKGQQKTY